MLFISKYFLMTALQTKQQFVWKMNRASVMSYSSTVLQVCSPSEMLTYEALWTIIQPSITVVPAAIKKVYETSLQTSLGENLDKLKFHGIF